MPSPPHSFVADLRASCGLAFAAWSLVGCFDPDRAVPEAGVDTSAAASATSLDPQGSDGGSGAPGGSSESGASDACTGASDCDDDNPCTDDACVDAACSHAPRTDDPACSCAGPDDCTQFPPDDACRSRTCIDGVCGQRFADAGTRLNESLQTPEDCRVVACDGAGEPTTLTDDTDVPDDGLECTEDACVDGVPHNGPAREGTPCAAGSCNDAGQCTGCRSADDCGGRDEFCQQITCDDGICGVMSTPANTPLPDGDQTTGDCQLRICDGRGKPSAVADDLDLPGDDGTSCTDETCSDGEADHTALDADTPCDRDGGSVCDGEGACVECNTAEQCPTAPPCHVAECVDHACTVTVAMMGTGCNDGLFCTQSDACNAVGVCVGTGNPCPGPDGDGDCSETCNEAADACTGNDASNTPCSDGLFCTGGDVCNGAGACIPGGNPCPGPDGDGDCSEMCNEAADACTGNDANGSDCGDCLTCSNGLCGGGCGSGTCCEGTFCINANQECP